MEQNLVVLQGKVFTVDIQSMFGSTNYGWCLTSLPAEIILMGAENISSGFGPVTQRFYFGAVSAETINVDIPFVLMCWSDFTQAVDTYTAHIRIIPSDSGNYSPYSENGNVKYGYACDQVDTANAAMPYGMVYSGNNAAANTPIFSNNVPDNTPIFSNNTAANTPIFSNNGSANTPIFSNNTAANTPIFSNNGSANTPIFSNNGAANTPIFSNNTAANTPIFRNNAAVNTPIYSNSTAANTPIFRGNTPVLKYGFPGCC